MGYQAPFPDQLGEVEYVQAYFHLELTEAVDLPDLALLQLRRELVQTLKLLSAAEADFNPSGLQRLLIPAMPSDPTLVKQLQKPAPAFVLSPRLVKACSLRAQQRLVLPVLLVGTAIHQLKDVWGLLEALGTRGLTNNRGRFTVEAVESENAEGQKAMLWVRGEPVIELTPPVNDLAWWLDRQSNPGTCVCLSLLSPARLIQRGKPLFNASFSDLFPFILRRVTSVLAHHGGVDLAADIPTFFRYAHQLETVNNRLHWKDWRRLQRIHGEQSLGGVLGDVSVKGSALGELLWLLQLGSLFNVGKGAAYGAGQYQLYAPVKEGL